MKKELRFEFTADTKDFKSKVDEVRDDIKAFKSRIEDQEAIKLSLNVATIQKQIDLVKAKIKTAKDNWDLQAEITLTADLERMKQSLTSAKRELRNYARTGEKDVSVLGKLFAWVNSEIDKSRLELIKLGKSTEGLDKIEKQLNDLNTEFKDGKISVQEYGRKLNQLEDQISWTGGKFDGLKWILKSTAGFFIAWLGVSELISFAKESVLAFAEFEKGLARINTVANVSYEQMAGLWNQIKNISVLYWQAKDELLETGFNISSAWVEFQNVSKILELSAITALGAGTDTTTAFNWIIAVVKKYWENINEAWNIAEKFFIANKLGQTTIEDMANAMQNLTSTAKPAGVTINEVFAILSTLTWVTGDANAVITQLNGAINAIVAPTTDASNKFKELGIEVGKGAVEQRGFVTVAKEIYDAVGGNLEQLRKLIPEVEAQKLIVALATTQNDKYKISLDEVTNGQGNLEEAVKKMSNTTSFQLDVASRKWANFKTTVWNSLVKIGAWLYDFGRVAKSIFLWVFGYILGSAGIALGGLVTLVIGGLTDVVNNFKEFARVLPEYVKLAMNKLPQIASVWIRKMLGVFGDLGGEVADKLGLTESLGDVFSSVDTNYKWTNTKASVDTFMSQMDKLTNWVKAEFQKAWDIISWNSKEQNDAIKDTVESIKQLDQSFGSVSDTIEDTTKSQDDLTKSTWGATKKAEEQKKAEEEAKKELEKKQDAIKKLADTNSKAYGEILDDMDKSIESMEKYIDKIDEVGEKIQEMKDDAVDNIRDINNELGNIWVEQTEKLGARYVAILKEQKDIQKQISEEEDYQKKIELQDQLNKLKQEEQLILANTTEEQRKQADIEANKSDAQKIIDEANAQKVILEERQMIYEAIANGEKINIDEITDYKNLKLAEDLTAKQEALDSELATLKDNFEKQRQETIKFNNDRKQFEADWTKFFWTEINKQIEYQKQLQQTLLRTIALQKQAGVSWVGFGTALTPEQEAKAQANATASNTKNVNITQNNYNLVDFDQAMRQINNSVE